MFKKLESVHYESLTYLKSDINYWDELVDDNAKLVSSSASKRILDVFISSLFLLLIFSWLYPIIAVLIKLTSKGSVFFVQKRIGYKGNTFNCYKFRTMQTNDKNNKYTPTTHNDLRITSFGRILRKSNFDEFPQFLNVFLGNMSLVGPRPHPIPFHMKYSSYIDDINKRLVVKPGITGLAQIMGYRGDVIDDSLNKIRTKARIKYDLLYIKKWTFIIDLKIIFITFYQMVTGKAKAH